MSEGHPQCSQNPEDTDAILIVSRILGILECYRGAGIAIVHLDSIKAHRNFIRRKSPNPHLGPDTCVIVAWDAPGWARYELYKAGVINWTAAELVEIARREIDCEAVNLGPVARQRAQPLVQHSPGAIAEFFRVLLRR